MDFRPTFYFEDNKTQPIRAGGVIFYKEENSKIKILMIRKMSKTNFIFEDIGGKTDVTDITEYDTISREVNEETNLVINKEITKNELEDSFKIYIPQSKYLLCFVKANSYVSALKTSHFGNKEMKDNIIRTINWINLDTYLNNKVRFNPRINGIDVRELIKNQFKASSNT